MNRSFLARAQRELEAGHPVVRAVIIKTWGSTPREVGADMLLDSEGGLLGTVGGGCGEAEVYELAQDMLHQPIGLGQVLHVDLTENPEDGGGKVCGGRFDVLLHRLSPESDLEHLRQVNKSLEAGQAVVWETGLGTFEPGFWKDGLVRVAVTPRLSLCPDSLEEPVWVQQGEENRFREPLGRTRQLVIVGAGHIARPLARMAALAGYCVSILDDRSEYAQAKFFPQSNKVVCGPYEVELPKLIAQPHTSVVLVTRGHRHDQDCLRLVAESALDYLGMIGSQRRIDAVFAELVEEGVRADALARVCAPVGLDIGAQTPAEIAVSILAEMIQLRRTGRTSREPVARRRHQKSLR